MQFMPQTFDQTFLPGFLAFLNEKQATGMLSAVDIIVVCRSFYWQERKTCACWNISDEMNYKLMYCYQFRFGTIEFLFNLIEFIFLWVFSFTQNAVFQCHQIISHLLYFTTYAQQSKDNNTSTSIDIMIWAVNMRLNVLYFFF